MKNQTPKTSRERLGRASTTPMHQCPPKDITTSPPPGHQHCWQPGCHPRQGPPTLHPRGRCLLCTPGQSRGGCRMHPGQHPPCAAPILAAAANRQRGLGLHVCKGSGVPSLRDHPCPCGAQDPLRGQPRLHGLPRGTLCSGAWFEAVTSGPRSTSPYISMKGE